MSWRLGNKSTPRNQVLQLLASANFWRFFAFGRDSSVFLADASRESFLTSGGMAMTLNRYAQLQARICTQRSDVRALLEGRRTHIGWFTRKIDKSGLAAKY
jgi:hypothetical protein